MGNSKIFNTEKFAQLKHKQHFTDEFLNQTNDEQSI
jgi:hypothetical protein